MLKRVLGALSFAASVGVLAGCPIYVDGPTQRVCEGGSCYDCPPGYATVNQCDAWSCTTALDCPSGYQCTAAGRCSLPGQTGDDPPRATCAKPADCAAGQTCGADNRCHTNGCETVGCPANHVCKLTGGVATCEPFGPAPDAGKSGCSKDAECASVPGAKCLTGACVAPADQCNDATQCRNGQVCADGACTPTCSETTPCPTGFACDLAKGVCTAPVPGCGAGCAAGTTCVADRCVAPCGAGNACGERLVCVDGGCVPDQRPVFTCGGDGRGTGCATESVCLRHSCYIACDADAGAEACRASDAFNVCKSVATAAGSFSVCGSSANLGDECDPSQGKACAQGQICIDGFCR